MRAFYEAHNPERLDLPEIVDKYKTQQDKLWAKLEKKYPGTATSFGHTRLSEPRVRRAALYEPGLRPPVPNAPLWTIYQGWPFLPHSSEYHDTRVKQDAHHVAEGRLLPLRIGRALLSQVKIHWGGPRYYGERCG